MAASKNQPPSPPAATARPKKERDMGLGDNPNIPPEGEYDAIFRKDIGPNDKTVCFLCFERIGYPSVYWFGADGAIWFHPACALEFGRKLSADVEQLIKWQGIKERNAPRE